MKNTPLVPFQAGSPIIISGPTGSGKTYWTHKLLTRSPEALCRAVIFYVLYFIYIFFSCYIFTKVQLLWLLHSCGSSP